MVVKQNEQKMEGFSTEFLKETMMHMVKVLGEPAREYKDRVFRMLLKDRNIALEVYNAMNDTSYDNPNDLTITTLENATYMGMKNDVSFVIASQLVLYEHQSTVNKNMPLRNLIYVTCIYSALTRNENLYGRKMIPLPEPKFVVFYNGTEKIPDVVEQRLSEAYIRHSGEPDLDLKITILNINEGHNQELAQKSPTLHQYMIFVDTVRKYQEQMKFDMAIEKAVDECIRNGILEDFLKRNKAEVLRMSIFEYDQETHMKQEREESEAIGEARGKKKGHIETLTRQVIRKLDRGLNVDEIIEALEENSDEIREICEVAGKYAPDYDVDKICEELLQEK
jgi:hypothetical protein